MKYLKLFESNTLVKLITMEYWRIKVWGKELEEEDEGEDEEAIEDHISEKWEDFTDDEILKIKQYNFGKITFEREVKKAVHKSIKISDAKSPLAIKIFKLRDEWYYVFVLYNI